MKMRYRREHTLNAKLDEIGVDVRRVADDIVPTLKERRRGALIEQTVL